MDTSAVRPKHRLSARQPSHVSRSHHRLPHPHQPQRINPLLRWQRMGLYLSLALLAASGAVWLLAHFLGWPVPPQMEGLPSPWEPGLMKLHGAAAMAALFLVGSLAATHIPRGWRLQRRRRTGVALLTCAAGAALTGYLLYYWAPENWRDGIGLGHSVVGMLMALGLLLHRRPKASSG